MKIRVKLFAAAREQAGQQDVALELPSEADVRAVKHHLALAFPQLASLVTRSLIAVNSEYATNETPVTEGDEVALIPPVSGG
jgi:molybdopterin converting factor subunit 1